MLLIHEPGVFLRYSGSLLTASKCRTKTFGEATFSSCAPTFLVQPPRASKGSLKYWCFLKVSSKACLFSQDLAPECVCVITNNLLKGCSFLYHLDQDERYYTCRVCSYIFSWTIGLVEVQSKMLRLMIEALVMPVLPVTNGTVCVSLWPFSL